MLSCKNIPLPVTQHSSCRSHSTPQVSLKSPHPRTLFSRQDTEAAKVACQRTIRNVVVREAGRFRAVEGRRSHRPAGGGGGSAVTCWPSEGGLLRPVVPVFPFPIPFKGFECTIFHEYFGRPSVLPSGYIFMGTGSMYSVYLLYCPSLYTYCSERFCLKIYIFFPLRRTP